MECSSGGFSHPSVCLNAQVQGLRCLQALDASLPLNKKVFVRDMILC